MSSVGPDEPTEAEAETAVVFDPYEYFISVECKDYIGGVFCPHARLHGVTCKFDGSLRRKHWHCAVPKCAYTCWTTTRVSSHAQHHVREKARGEL